MSDKVRQFPTASELAAFLSTLPPETEVYVETVKDIDLCSGAAYLPRLKLVTLVGSRTEIEVDAEDWETVNIFGDVGLYDDTEGAGDDDEESENGGARGTTSGVDGGGGGDKDSES